MHTIPDRPVTRAGRMRLASLRYFLPLHCSRMDFGVLYSPILACNKGFLHMGEAKAPYGFMYREGITHSGYATSGMSPAFSALPLLGLPN